MNIDKSIERIAVMEQHLDNANDAVKELSAALDRYISAKESIDILKEYYTSPLWPEDFKADEDGLLPADLKRGVLSEDALHNLLCDNRILIEKLKDISE